MQLPKNAMDFIQFMETVWEMKHAPSKDGGVLLLQHPDYDRYHDAMKMARVCGMQRTGGSYVGDKAAHVFRFPDEMHTGVCVAVDGGGVRLARAYGPKGSPEVW